MTYSLTLDITTFEKAFAIAGESGSDVYILEEKYFGQEEYNCIYCTYGRQIYYAIKVGGSIQSSILAHSEEDIWIGGAQYLTKVTQEAYDILQNYAVQETEKFEPTIKTAFKIVENSFNFSLTEEETITLSFTPPSYFSCNGNNYNSIVAKRFVKGEHLTSILDSIVYKYLGEEGGEELIAYENEEWTNNYYNIYNVDANDFYWLGSPLYKRGVPGLWGEYGWRIPLKTTETVTNLPISARCGRTQVSNCSFDPNSISVYSPQKKDKFFIYSSSPDIDSDSGYEKIFFKEFYEIPWNLQVDYFELLSLLEFTQINATRKYSLVYNVNGYNTTNCPTTLTSPFGTYDKDNKFQFVLPLLKGFSNKDPEDYSLKYDGTSLSIIEHGDLEGLAFEIPDPYCQFTPDPDVTDIILTANADFSGKTITLNTKLNEGDVVFVVPYNNTQYAKTSNAIVIPEE